MNKNFYFLVFLMMGFLFACNTPANEEEVIEEIVENEHEHDSNEADETPLALNNGAKWEVNKEMLPHIENGERLLNLYFENGGSDYLQLADDIAAENSNLIKSCTMEGESHDELHKWLHPHLEITKALKEAQTDEESHKIIGQLIESYGTFHQYFE